ncbi:MAG TPA: permease [Candidatus Omnitrophota bacterium]|nr:permease [Candidatus Omnitrophota bacterium]HPD85553.1 permease [Candidatus Omnitrophota bacterium]HRZ04407.1 permease [Candidatus Omnitrophota bacterium]
MEFIDAFLGTFSHYIQELWFSVLIGFLLSGILYEFIPSNIIEKYLGQKGIMPIFAASLIGVVLPVCCFGSLPIALTMKRKGARLGPVLAFLVTTPATSAPALIICWKLMGPAFTLYIFFAVIVMGLIMGLIGNVMSRSEVSKPEGEFEKGPGNDCCCTVSQGKQGGVKHSHDLFTRIKSVLTYSLITLPKEIGLELLLGVVIASLIMVFTPAQHLIKQYLSGVWGYVFALIVGLATYVCSTGNVPMADAFLKSGMAYGPVMVYLLVGPITSYGMIFAVKKSFGGKVLAAYLWVICVMSIVLGIGFNLMMSRTIF